MRAFLVGLALTLLAGSASADTFTMCKTTVETEAGPRVFATEYADDDAERQQGLMFREAMPRGHGMLFRFGRTAPVAMWMKNTILPLDMIFIREDGTVARVHEGAVPGSLDVIRSGSPVLYVLELNAGVAAEAGLKAGQSVTHTCEAD